MRTSVSPFVTWKGRWSGQCSGGTCGGWRGGGGGGSVGRVGSALGFWACPPSLRSLYLRAGKVEARPTSCLFRVLCDHRWSGLGPRGSLRPAVLQSFLPARWVWSPRIRWAELENILPHSVKTQLVEAASRGAGRVLPPATQSGGRSARRLQPAGERDFASALPGSGIGALFLQASHFPTGDYPPTKIYFQKKLASATVPTPSAELLWPLQASSWMQALYAKVTHSTNTVLIITATIYCVLTTFQACAECFKNIFM